MAPQGLSRNETVHYNTLLDVVAARSAKGIEAPRIVVITDLAKDYDDLAALLVLKELHRLRVVTLVGLIANLRPAEDRARFGRGALDLLGLNNLDPKHRDHVRIARGTTGYARVPQTKATIKKHKVLPYEFECDFMVTDDPNNKLLMNNDELEGERLLKEICLDAKQTGKKVKLLLISSLEDIFTFNENNPGLLKDAVSDIVIQGGCLFNAKGKLVPDPTANNNRYDMDAADKFFAFVQDQEIPSCVYTKVAAFATPLTSELFHELEKTGHPIGRHLRRIQVVQDLAFFKVACAEQPEKRFAPHMDQEWYLKNKTSWFESKHAPGTPFPKDEEVIPWLNKVVIYDALAAIGSAGDDAIAALDILTENTQPASIHRVVGFAGPPPDIGIYPEKMANVLSALLKGSLLACQQKIF
jgi:hypothetical protein